MKLRIADCGLRNGRSYGIQSPDRERSAPNSELPTPHSKGFSLIEVIITLVVLSIAVVGILSVFTTGIRGSADPLMLGQAVQFAQEKMDEITADRRNPARGYAWMLPANYPADVPLAGFNRAVAMTCVDPADLNAPTGAPPCAGGHTRVTVTVTHAVTGSVTVDGLMTDY